MCLIGIVTLVSLYGIVLSALLIAVLTLKFQFSRWEKYVVNFVLNIELAYARKCAAANIIKYAFFTWRLKKRARTNSLEYLQMQREFFTWIREIQRIKREQRKLVDSCIGLAEIMNSQHEVNRITDDTANQVDLMQMKIDRLETQMENMNVVMQSIQSSINVLLMKSMK